MRLKIKISTYEVDADQNMEILANMEDFYAMLDRINPLIIRNYIAMNNTITRYISTLHKRLESYKEQMEISTGIERIRLEAKAELTALMIAEIEEEMK